MQIHTLTCAAVAVLASGSALSAALIVAPFPGGDAGFNALTNNGTLERAVAEGRIGNALTTGTWETAIWQQGGVGVPKSTAQLNINNGASLPFTLVWNGVDTVTYTVGSTTISWNEVAGGFTDIFIRSRSATDSTLSLTNMSIDLNNDASLEWSGGSLSSTGNGTVNYLRLTNMGMNFPAFTLSGTQNLSWTGVQPANSALAYQIKLTNVIPAPGAGLLLAFGGLTMFRRRR
ncbi:MAG: hypothetical protein KF768_07610 [Phycisphaeraceae bacterium]|nr:hypothetical protein [Phycisphaeraceae bacterium]